MITPSKLTPVDRFVAAFGMIPSSYKEAMTYEEQLVWLCNYLETEILPAINNNADGLIELQGLYVALKDYVDNYFEDLDVQTEINNKLDEMVQSGELQELLAEQYAELKEETEESIATFENETNTAISTFEGNITARITNFENETNANITNFENETNANITTFQNSVSNSINGIEDVLENLTSGAPLVASSTSEMTDTSRIYVNTADGNWYYYNGTTWVSGGTYQSSGIQDGSIDILMLKDNLQSNYALRYSTDISKGEGFQGGCKGSVGNEIVIDTSTTASYKYYVVSLDAGAIYTYSGKQPSGFRGLVITDSNNIIKYIAPYDSSGAVVSATFKTNEAGMKAYISRYIQSTTGNAVEVYKFENSFRLRKLEEISNALKFDTQIELLERIDGYMAAGQTVGNDLTIAQQANCYLYCYPMEKGKHYITKSYHYSYAKAYVLTDLKYKVLTQDATPSGGSATLITNEFTATQDGYIYLFTNSPTNSPVSVEITTNFDVQAQQYEMIKNKKIVYDGDSICESRTTGNAANGGAFARMIAEITNSNYVNQAVGGAHLAHWTTTERHCVVDNLTNLPTDADLYVFCAGINDFWGDTEIGQTTSDYTTNVDTTTIKGAMEYIFRYMLNNMPTAKVLFIIEHKITNTAIAENENHDTFKDYHDAMIEICNKYSIPYYDAFNNSNLNGWNTYQSALYLTANTTQTADGVHPNADGYKKFYVPQLLEIYKAILEKEDE